MTEHAQIPDFKARPLYLATVAAYLIALSAFVVGWFVTGPHLVALLLCLPLILLIPAAIQRRRRYYQLMPNLLVLYIGWSLIERLINPEMKVYAGIAVFTWVVCLILMLKLIRTSYLVDGGHYIPDPERKRKRLERKQARQKIRAEKKAEKKARRNA